MSAAVMTKLNSSKEFFFSVEISTKHKLVLKQSILTHLFFVIKTDSDNHAIMLVCQFISLSSIRELKVDLKEKVLVLIQWIGSNALKHAQGYEMHLVKCPFYKNYE